jgi:hypothetical protein
MVLLQLIGLACPGLAKDIAVAAMNRSRLNIQLFFMVSLASSILGSSRRHAAAYLQNQPPELAFWRFQYSLRKDEA